MCKGDSASGSVYNKIDPTMTVGQTAQTAIYDKASKGAIEPSGELLKLVNVKGPFTLEAYVCSNASSDKTDRYAYIKAGAEGSETEVVAPNKADNKVPVAGQVLSYEYTGTDKINVIIGCVNATNNDASYLRVYDVKLTTAEAQDQSSNVAFNSASKELDISLSTLGLIGATVTSSDETIATATLADSKITATSVKEGVATLTVKDANNKEAKVMVIVAEDGTVSFGTITKFTRSAPTVTITNKSSDASAADGKGTVTWDGLTDLEWSLDGNDWLTVEGVQTHNNAFTVTVEGTTATVEGIQAGTYYVRGKASDAYEASEKATVNVSYEGATETYTLDVSTAEFTDIVKTSGQPTTGSCTINGLQFDIVENKDKNLPDTQNNTSVINMAGSVSTEKNYVKFTTTKAATVTITFFQSNADRHAKIITATNSTGQTGSEATTSDKSVKSTSFALPSAGTYYLGGDNGIYITKIVVEM